MHYNIVIVGGGAGGLELAASLGRALGRDRGRDQILLIDRAMLHIWKPTLHEVAAGTLDPHHEGLSYPVLARRNHFSYALGELSGLNTEAKCLTLKEIRDEAGQTIMPERVIAFTWLVLATGSGSNFFGTPGAARNAFVLEQTEDAERFHARLLTAFIRAAFSNAAVLTIAIVGAGATGVELSAELLEAHREFQQSLSAAQRFPLSVRLVEAADRILAGLPEKVSAQATAALERQGVRILTQARVDAVEAERLQTSRGPIEADLIVWAAGVKAGDANALLGPRTTRLNQFEVDDHLMTSAPDIYALGDCAACPWRDGRLAPPRAQVAHQQARYLRKALLARLSQRTVSRPFAYRDFGSLVSLGENRGVGALMGNLGGRNFLVEGLTAKAMYISLHLAHHLAILGLGRTVVLALARLLQERVSGRLKLH